MKPFDRLDASLTAEGRYRLLIEAVTDYAIYMLDATGVVVSWNPGAQRFKGYTSDEILGSHFSRFYVEADRQAGLPGRALKIAAEQGKFESEGWRLRKDGSRFWAHVVIDPIRGPSGDLVGFAKITRDLTERKAAEEELRQSLEQFRILVQGVTDYAIYMLDPEGKVSSWNLGAQKIKGYAAEEIVGQHFSRFYTEEDRENDEPARALEVATREGRFEKESWRVRKDGTRFWANVVIDPIRGPDGKILGFAKVTRDITERRDAQLALEQARETLFQSQKMDALGQLTGGVAHDFNNLLSAVLGSLELVRKRLPDDPMTVPLVDNAIQAAQRGAVLTQRMLAFARRQELDREPIDLGGLVRGMADMLQRSLGPSIPVGVHFPLTLARVLADANQLEMALLNLAVNARDAMPDGGPVTIAAREETVGPGHPTALKPGRYVCLSVTDSGQGMDEATLARATEPFFTTKGVGQGTGLGLSMVHGATDQMGGRLVLRSRKGEGTTAELWLPALEEEKPAAAADAEPPAVPEVKDTIGPLVVLAVDDDALILMNTGAMLEDLGHTALKAMSGKQALEVLGRETNIDLVITDQAMPNMTGIQLVEAIRAERPDLPVVLATGYADLPPGAVSGMVKLAKPFLQHDLSQAIAEAIRTQPPKAQVLKFRLP